jgi:hypothetical protein
VPPLHIGIIFLKKSKSQILVVFQSSSSYNVFGQILVLLGTFRQIWANFAAFVVAENMPKLGLK